jgi:hypothetical protein
VCEATSEHEDVYPPLDLGKHETAHGCQPLLVDLGSATFFFGGLLAALRELFQVGSVIAEYLAPRSDIREDGGQVPSFEYFLLDEIAVICADERL